MNEAKVFQFPAQNLESEKVKDRSEEEHVPAVLRRMKLYDEAKIDERGFLDYLPSIKSFEKFVVNQYDNLSNNPEGAKNFNEWSYERYKEVVHDLILSLGRVPSFGETERELYRQGQFTQLIFDQTIDKEKYEQSEVIPQNKSIDGRKNLFPKDPEKAKKAFETAEARIETEGDKIRLYIPVKNDEGEIIDHPVMTNEEKEWVVDSAKSIFSSVGKDGKIFIAGLGLGLLNTELCKLGLNNHVVAELNHSVIKLMKEKLKKENPEINLDVRQGDFKEVLREAINNGEQFDAVSIDAFPNTPDEINRDASSKEVIKMMFDILRKGGFGTFYPDSRYLAKRIVDILTDMDIPKTSIHYIVSEFNTSDDFTKLYHYGKLMAVPMIQKPILSEKSDKDKIDNLSKEYFTNLEAEIKRYIDGNKKVVDEKEFKKAA